MYKCTVFIKIRAFFVFVFCVLFGRMSLANKLFGAYKKIRQTHFTLKYKELSTTALLKIAYIAETLTHIDLLRNWQSETWKISRKSSRMK